MDTVKLSELKTTDDLIREEMENDPLFREEWERTSLARVVANSLITFRNLNNLSQEELSEKLNLSLEKIEELEVGEENPEVNILKTIETALNISFN